MEIEFYSQADQDKWVCERTNYKLGGFFVEVGAYDGIQTSNTFALEKFLGWVGICIEANPVFFERLKKNRTSHNIFAAVSDFNGEIGFGEDAISESGQYKVPAKTLNQILEKCEAPSVIDYLSIDIEGHEFTALKHFDFNRWHINRITVEHNLYLNGPEQKEKLFELLSSKDFIRVVEDAPCLDSNPSVYGKPYEDWYENKILK
jgi:FkbM family methyltransferase